MNNVIQTLSDLISGRQHNRILRLSFPLNDGPAAELLVEKIDAVESMSRDFEFTVQLLSNDANLALKDMQGKLLSVALVRKDGSLRYFSGYVFSFRRQKSDGGITFYEASLGPWLKCLSLRKDNYLFHGKTLRQQSESIFADYSTYPNWDWRVAGDDPEMTDACQFNETDFNYLSRRWEAAGWLYWYEHTATGHQLIVSDDSTQAAPIEGGGEIRFQRHGGIQEEDAIDHWSPVRHLMPASVALSGFDFKKPTPTDLVVPTLNQQGDVPAIESYEYVGAYSFKNARDGDRLGRIRMEEFEADGKVVEAEGNNRFVIPGHAYHLTDHFSDDPFDDNGQPDRNEYLILEVHHTATNNYLHEANDPPLYRNRMTCIRKKIPWRPGRSFNSVDTKILAPQTATVVGPSGTDSIHTDEFGRIRVQFHWDRIGNNDERSSAWLRVASPWAGAELGVKAPQRVGSEVVVQWLDGNPDRPFVTGSLYNERNMPPWELATQQSLMGLRSRELTPNGGNAAGGRSNHLILDDTNEKIQAQLKSDHASSQLSLGHIVRIEDTGGRKDERGEGWELATNAWGVARAGRGMLITTEARPNAKSHIKDMDETVLRLNAARQEQEAHALLAQQHGAQEKTDQQSGVAEDIKAQNKAIKGSEGAPGSSAFPELAEPHLVLASAAGFAVSSAQSTHIASGEHVVVTAGKNVSIAAGNSLFASIRQTFRLFVHKAGMKLIAAAGDIDMSALSNSINLLAKLNITQTGNRITITAAEEIVINGAGSYGKFNASGIELGTRTTFRVRASMKHFESGNALPVSNINLPVVDGFDEQFRLVDEHDNALPNASYVIRSACGKVWEGVSDANGMTQRVYTDKPSALSLEINSDKEGKFDQHFVLTNDKTRKPLEHVPYKIRLADGRSYEGVTDEKGKTEMVYGNAPLGATIEVLL